MDWLVLDGPARAETLPRVAVNRLRIPPDLGWASLPGPCGPVPERFRNRSVCAGGAGCRAGSAICGPGILNRSQVAIVPARCLSIQPRRVACHG
jgi:hypothetical protein